MVRTRKLVGGNKAGRPGAVQPRGIEAGRENSAPQPQIDYNIRGVICPAFRVFRRISPVAACSYQSRHPTRQPGTLSAIPVSHYHGMPRRVSEWLAATLEMWCRAT